MEKITAKGIGKLDDLRNKILTKFGFKKIWLEKRGKFVELLGEFNAKVLLMREDGKPDVDAMGNQKFRDLTAAERKAFGNDKYIGKTTEDGTVVSNAFETRFGRMSAADKVATLDKLNDANLAARRAEGLKGATPDITLPASTKTQGLDEVNDLRPRTPDEQKIMDDLADKRKADIGNPDKLRTHSEAIGERAADMHASKHGLETVHSGKGAYDLDRVYKKGDTFYVFEAKGGSSTLGGKQVDLINLATRKPHFGQQGTREYLERTIQDMAGSVTKLWLFFETPAHIDS
jgi:hypothetical protein